jgi:hypothetical protein
MLPDRQDFPGMDTHKGVLLKRWLDGGAIRKAKAEAERRAKSYALMPHDRETVTLYEDTVGIIKANPQGSHGYLYVVAWLKEEAS